MEQRDYLKRQLDQLGKVLEKLFSDLLGKKSQGKISEGIEMTNQAFKEQLSMNAEELVAIQTDNFINTLITEKGLNNENLNKLADILLLIADNNQDKDKKLIYEKCLAIYKYLEKAETVYSLDIRWKIERIKNEL